MSDIDTLIGLWHTLADDAASNKSGIFTTENEAIVTTLRKVCLNDDEDCSFKSEPDFISYIAELRRNEKTWSRKLGNTILAACDHLEEGKPDSAYSLLHEFAENCPWSQLKEHAINQIDAMKEKGNS